MLLRFECCHHVTCYSTLRLLCMPAVFSLLFSFALRRVTYLSLSACIPTFFHYQGVSLALHYNPPFHLWCDLTLERLNIQIWNPLEFDSSATSHPCSCPILQDLVLNANKFPFNICDMQLHHITNQTSYCIAKQITCDVLTCKCKNLWLQCAACGWNPCQTLNSIDFSFEDPWHLLLFITLHKF